MTDFVFGGATEDTASVLGFLEHFFDVHFTKQNYFSWGLFSAFEFNVACVCVRSVAKLRPTSM